MTSKRIADPALPAVTVEQAKKHLRISTSDDDEVLSNLINAAINFLERDTGLSLINQTWRFWFDAVPADNVILIDRRPANGVTAFKVYDRAGNPSDVEPESYFLNTVTTPARLRLAADHDWHIAANGLEIDIETGFGETGADVPDSLIQAVLCLVAHWFEFRSAFDADDQPVSIPDAYTRLTKPWRRMGL